MQNNAELETRHTVYMDKETMSVISDMATIKNWSFSHTCYTLLQQAIKEKNRKKKKSVASHE
jgi:hypothetical protein